MGVSNIPAAPPEAERLFDEGGLTDRERDAARSVLAGMTAREAAGRMGVSASTVGSLRQRSYHKLNVHGAAELVERFGAPDSGAAWLGAGDDTRSALLSNGLSETQADVLLRVASGKSSAQISDELGIAPGTVSSARAMGYRLLGVHSREELVERLSGVDEKDAALRTVPRHVVAVLVALAALAVVGAAAWVALGMGSPGARTEGAPAPEAPGQGAAGTVELVGVSYTHGVVSLDEVVQGYYDSGARDVQVTRVGSVDESACVITEALSDGDPRVLPDGLYEGASIHLTVTSDVEVPRVIDMSPIEASRTLWFAGLEADPCFDSFNRAAGNLSPHEPRVESMSVDPGTVVRAGTTVHLEYNASLDEYSNESNVYGTR